MNKIKAYTLVEVLIVVAILATIVAIAVPMYGEQMNKSRRSDAKQALLAASEAVERYKAANFSYAALNGNLGTVFSTQVPVEGGTAYYNLQISATATTYTITATGTGAMASDGNFTIDQAGQKTYKGSSGWPK